MAIILDGQILSAPRLRTAVGADSVIEGNFTRTEVDRLVTLLQAGALPAQLRPVPVTELVIEPKSQTE